MKMNLSEKINPKHTTLIVIDVQNDFASPDHKFFRASRNGDLTIVDPMIDKLEKTIPVAKRAGVDVIYTQQIYDPAKLNDLQKEQYELDSRLVTCNINSEGHKLYKINPDMKDVYKKNNFNIFSNDELVGRLVRRNTKTLVLTGMDIVFCVETAIRNGFDLGYKIVVAEDMIAGNARYMDLNNKTLELVKMTFGVVSNSAELIFSWRDYTNKANL